MWYIEDNAGYREGFATMDEALVFGDNLDAMWQTISLYYED